MDSAVEAKEHELDAKIKLYQQKLQDVEDKEKALDLRIKEQSNSQLASHRSDPGIDGTQNASDQVIEALKEEWIKERQQMNDEYQRVKKERDYLNEAEQELRRRYQEQKDMSEAALKVAMRNYHNKIEELRKNITLELRAGEVTRDVQRLLEQDEIQMRDIEIAKLQGELKAISSKAITTQAFSTLEQSIQCDSPPQQQSIFQTELALVNPSINIQVEAKQDQMPLEEKYHILKKKLVKSKEANETLQTDYSKLKLSYEELSIQSRAQQRADQEIHERRMKELEGTITKAYQNLRSLDSQVKDLQEINRNLEQELKQRETTTVQMHEDMKTLVQYKNILTPLGPNDQRLRCQLQNRNSIPTGVSTEKIYIKELPRARSSL